MLRYAFVFLVIAIVAAVLGFGHLAGTAAPKSVSSFSSSLPFSRS